MPGPGGAVEEMEVGAAHAAGLDCDDHVARSVGPEIDLLGPQVAGAVEPQAVDCHRSNDTRPAKAKGRLTVTPPKVFCGEGGANHSWLSKSDA